MKNLCKKYYRFPINIYIEINESFFANIQWYLYKYFHITRNKPCGRRNKDSFLCCRQPMIADRMWLSDDKKECFCKVCGKRRVLANHELDINNLYDF